MSLIMLLAGMNMVGMNQVQLAGLLFWCIYVYVLTAGHMQPIRLPSLNK
jgi:hypothetical protein